MIAIRYLLPPAKSNPSKGNMILGPHPLFLLLLSVRSLPMRTANAVLMQAAKVKALPTAGPGDLECLSKGHVGLAEAWSGDGDTIILETIRGDDVPHGATLQVTLRWMSDVAVQERQDNSSDPSRCFSCSSPSDPPYVRSTGHPACAALVMHVCMTLTATSLSLSSRVSSSPSPSGFRCLPCPPRSAVHSLPLLLSWRRTLGGRKGHSWRKVSGALPHPGSHRCDVQPPSTSGRRNDAHWLCGETICGLDPDGRVVSIEDLLVVSWRFRWAWLLCSWFGGRCNCRSAE